MERVTDFEERRTARRSKRPLEVSCLGVDLISDDWSTAGLKLKNFRGGLPFLGETVDLRVSFVVKGNRISLACEGKVVRVEPEQRMFAIHFSELLAPEFDLLREFTTYN